MRRARECPASIAASLPPDPDIHITIHMRKASRLRKQMHWHSKEHRSRTAMLPTTLCQQSAREVTVVPGRTHGVFSYRRTAMFARVVARRLIHHRPCGGACCRGMRTMMTSVSPLYVCFVCFAHPIPIVLDTFGCRRPLCLVGAACR